jgi:hypothetical protein
MDYEMGEITAGAIFYLAEIYDHFSRALMASERPEGLTPLELEEYELEIEDQAYPFEEKAIEVHESNLELISRGVYNDWIDKSLQKLAESVPVRYDKTEEASNVVSSLESYIFALARPEANALVYMPDSMVADEPDPSGAIGVLESGEQAHAAPVPVVESDAMRDTWTDQPPPEMHTESVEEAQAAAPVLVDESDAMRDTWANHPLQNTTTEPGESVQGIMPESIEEADPITETHTDHSLLGADFEVFSAIQTKAFKATNESVLLEGKNTGDESNHQKILGK